MPSRNMIAANTAVFGILDEYYLSQGSPISNAGNPRWIATNRSGRRFLINSALVAKLSFSQSVKLARFDLDNRAYFITSGIDVPSAPSGLQEEDLDGGILTAFLSELKIGPVASPAQIRQVVEVADKTSTPDYEGHDVWMVAGLYPNTLLSG